MRLFTAICFDDETKNALFSAGKEAERSAKGRFSAKENLHLTLVFIGETEKTEEIKSAISKIDFPPFDIKIEGTGLFEKGIFWAGTEKNENLENLRNKVQKELEELGFEFEEREFVPHITLARKFCPEKDFSFKNIEKLLPKEPVRANRISLMKSESIDGELKYTEIFSKGFS